MSAAPTSAAAAGSVPERGAGWHAVDGDGRDPGTGRPPVGRGARTPAGALAGVPVAAWPLAAVGPGGQTRSVGESLGRGGDRIEQLLDRLARRAAPPGALDTAALAAATPAGPVEVPVAVLDLHAAAQAAPAVDRRWMAEVEARREAPRRELVAGGRELELEAALHLAVLVATEEVDDAEPAARVASGGRLWLLGGTVAWALHDGFDDPFAAWADLVSYGLWPVGPTGGWLVVGAPNEPAGDVAPLPRVFTARTEAG